MLVPFVGSHIVMKKCRRYYRDPKPGLRMLRSDQRNRGIERDEVSLLGSRAVLESECDRRPAPGGIQYTLKVQSVGQVIVVPIR